MRADRSQRRSVMMDDPDSPKFTVNQIMLLQRLKQTGLTKAQILKGLEEMEKLEDLGFGGPGLCNTPSLPCVSSPSSHCSSGSAGNSAANMTGSREPEIQRRSTSPSSPRVKYGAGHLPHHLAQTNPLMFGAGLQTPNNLGLLPSVASWPNTTQAVAVATAASLLQNGFGPGSVHHSPYPSLLNGRGIVRNGCSGSTSGGNTVVEIDDEKIDITDELEELFRRDQASVKEDIRKFIGERHISQSAIAKATKNAISQSYISQWLAQPQDISGQKKKAMYTWFITEKRKPIGPSNGLCQQSPVTYRSSDTDQDSYYNALLKSKRGARFTWPKECLSILEGFYNDNSYPDECKREEIAHACNGIIQSQKPGGIIHSELDKVTTVKVYNWFANRRKDDKRRRHIEQIEAIGQQAMLSPRRSSTISPTPSCNSNESNRDDEANSIPFEKMGATVKRELPISLSMEMAAVNKSILTLVNPHRDFSSQEGDEEMAEEEHLERSRVNKAYSSHGERVAECGGFAA